MGRLPELAGVVALVTGEALLRLLEGGIGAARARSGRCDLARLADRPRALRPALGPALGLAEGAEAGRQLAGARLAEAALGRELLEERQHRRQARAIDGEPAAD